MKNVFGTICILNIFLSLFAGCGNLSAGKMPGEPARTNALDLPKDSEGWTVFTPSADTRIMYVSSDGDDSTGAVYSPKTNPDPFLPPDGIFAFRTYAAAFTHVRSGYPDWILFRRGDIFYEAIGRSVASGRSRGEPSLIGAYGNAGDSPLLKIGSSAGISIGYTNSAAVTSEYIAVQGLQFYSHTRNPADPEYTGTAGGWGISVFTYGSVNRAGNILIEGCSSLFNGAALYAAGGSPWVQDVDFRRNVIYGNYSVAGHAQGIWISFVDNLLLEENILDHNGWLIQSRTDNNTQAEGQATMFNHNIYTAGVTNTVFRDNMIMRASSMGTKFTAPDAASNTAYGNTDVKIADLVIENNLYMDGEIGIGLAGNYPDNHWAVENPSIRNNVFYDIGKSQPTNRGLSWGVDLFGIDGGSMRDNLFLNTLALDNTYGINIASESRNFEVADNIGFYLAGSAAFLITESGSESSVSIHDNYIERQGNTRAMIEADNPLPGIAFRKNNYYSSAAPSFRFLGANLTPAEWLATHESNARFTKRDFPDTTRTVESYLDSIGAAGGLDSFYERCRSQTRYNWDTRYTADAVNTWIRAGFGM